MSETKNRYATKKKGKTEVDPFWYAEDIKKMIDWFVENKEYDGYLTTMFGLLLGRRIGDTLSMKWSDFYYENGNHKNSVTTIQEQKTGKTLDLHISEMVFKAIDNYTNFTGINPTDNLEEYIFNVPCKTEWVKRRNDPIYKQNDLDAWCEYLKKDFSDNRKEKILEGFQKQKEYLSLGEYLYYEVEYTDVIKWQSDGYRSKFNQAAKDCKISYRVSTHTLRKTFGMWLMKENPYDPNCIFSLQRMFGHSDVQKTLNYIGLSKKKESDLLDAHGEVINKICDGDAVSIKHNSSITTLKNEDLRKIIMYAMGENESIEKFNIVMNMVDELKIQSH